MKELEVLIKLGLIDKFKNTIVERIDSDLELVLVFLNTRSYFDV